MTVNRILHKRALRSPHWKSIRMKALRLAKHRCSKCGSKRSLEVHHLHYGTLGAETVDDLEVLCAYCHTITHGRLWKPRKRIHKGKRHKQTLRGAQHVKLTKSEIAVQIMAHDLTLEFNSITAYQK